MQRARSQARRSRSTEERPNLAAELFVGSLAGYAAAGLVFAIGFVARITSALAEAGISVNPIAAYHHDHLLVPSDRAADTMAVLEGLSANR